MVLFALRFGVLSFKTRRVLWQPMADAINDATHADVGGPLA